MEYFWIMTVQAPAGRDFSLWTVRGVASVQAGATREELFTLALSAAVDNCPAAADGNVIFFYAEPNKIQIP